MRISIHIPTKKIIEMQSGGTTQAHLDTLLQNAINSGYAEADIEAKFVNDAEYEAAKLEDPDEIARLEAQEAARLAKLAQAQEVIDNLPAWTTVQTAVQGISDLAEAKVFIEKLARVVYILART